jgi:hypothetical protein
MFELKFGMKKYCQKVLLMKIVYKNCAIFTMSNIFHALKHLLVSKIM